MFHFKFTMHFVKDFHSYHADPPPPYSLPEEFCEAGITEDDLAILKEYDTVIIVDDSGSMGGLLWAQARDALSTLAEVASRYDTDGIDIHFLNSGAVKLKDQNYDSGWLWRRLTRNSRRFTSKQDVEQLFTQVKPGGPTPLGMCLDKVTSKLLRELRKTGQSKKTNYLVITDGKPTDNVEDSIVHIAKQLDKLGAPPSQLGIQFIQIGNNKEVSKFLAKLDDDLKEKHNIRDMIDTVEYTGDVTGPRLAKLLLGGINRRFDAKTIPPSIIPKGGEPPSSS